MWSLHEVAKKEIYVGRAYNFHSYLWTWINAQNSDKYNITGERLRIISICNNNYLKEWITAYNYNKVFANKTNLFLFSVQITDEKTF